MVNPRGRAIVLLVFNCFSKLLNAALKRKSSSQQKRSGRISCHNGPQRDHRNPKSTHI